VWVPGFGDGKTRPMMLADLEPLLDRRCTLDASTPGLSGGLALTGVLERVDDATIAVPRDLAVWRDVQPYSGDGRIPIADVTSVELA
jgi:hypothetical protein